MTNFISKFIEEAKEQGEIETPSKTSTRGGNDVLAKLAKYSNFCLLFGTKPARQVTLDTKMVENILDHLMLKRDARQTVQFP